MELIQIAMEEDEPVETESSWFDLGSAAEKEPAAAPGAVAVDGNVGQVWGFWENYDSRATDEESRIVHADMIDSKEYEGLKLALTFVIKVQFKFRSARRLAQLRRVEENNAACACRRGTSPCTNRKRWSLAGSATSSRPCSIDSTAIFGAG